MATRSVYEVDDVVATLLYALQVKNGTLAVQAARELRVSEETDLLINVLTFAQLLCDPRHFPMITPPTQDTMYDVLCLLVEHFPSELPKHKPQIPVPPPSPPQSESEQQYTFGWRIPSSFTPHQAHILESVVRTCISKKYWKHCVRVLTPLLHKHICALSSLLQMLGISKKLTDVLETIVYVPLSERLLLHAVIQLTYPQPVQPKINNKYESIWNSAAHGKRARTFQIPRGALQQWNVQAKSAKRIQESLIPQSVLDSQATLYWQHAGVPTDETIEEWFDAHFPDDIPDEWSRDEILKSHVYEQILIERKTHDWQPAFLLCWA